MKHKHKQSDTGQEFGVGSFIARLVLKVQRPTTWIVESMKLNAGKKNDKNAGECYR